MVRVYSEYYTRKYYASYLSFSSFCCASSFLVLIFLPFFLSFSVHYFWNKFSFYHEQPLVKPNGNVYIQASTASGSKYYSSIKAVREQYEDSLLGPIIKITASDHNDDGITDLITFSANIPISTKTIHQVSIAFGIDYELIDIGKTWFDTAAFYVFSSAKGIASIIANGDLVFRQKTGLIPSYERNKLYANESIFTYFNGRTFDEVMEINALRPQSVVGEGTSLVMPYGDDSILNIEITLHVPKQKVFYIPQMLEMFKFSWMQYMSFFMPLYVIIYSGILLALYKNGAMDSHVVEDPIISQLEKKKKSD